MEGISTLRFETATLFLSDIYTAVSSEAIETHNIGAILDCTFETYHLKYPNITCAKLPLQDTTSQRLDPGLYQAVGFVIQHLNAGINVLIFCHRGISRSATIAIAVVMNLLGMNSQDGFRFVAEQRDIINPNLGFCLQLESSETQIRSIRLTTNKYIQPDEELTLEVYHKAVTGPSSEIIVFEVEFDTPVAEPPTLIVW